MKKSTGGNSHFELPMSLGSMIQRQNESMIQNPALLKKLSSTRKSSVVNYLVDRKRTSSFSIDSFTIINQEANVKELAAKIKALYNSNICHFIGQISENVLKSNSLHTNVVGKTPDCIKDINFIENISLSSPSVSKPNEKAKLRGSSQVAESPSSMRGQLTKFNGNTIFEEVKEDKSHFSLELKKHNSGNNMPEPDLDANLSEEYYNNMTVRRSEQKPLRLDKIQEADNEGDFFVDNEKNKKVKFIENEFGTTRKDRAATFKPYNHRKNSSLDDKEMSKPLDQDLLMDIKDKMKKSYEEESKQDESEISDEELEQKVRASFNPEEISKLGLISASKSKPVNYEKKKEEKYYIEEEKSDYGNVNLSDTSKSRFSIPDSEKYDRTIEKVITQRNDIIDPIRPPPALTERISKKESKHVSIGRMQIGISKFQSAGKDFNNASSYEPSPLDVSQQARNMLASSYEVGNRRNSPYSANPEVPRNVEDNKRKSNLTSNSAFSDNNQATVNPLMLPYFGAPMNQANNSAVMNFQNFGMGDFNMSNFDPENPNQMMNPFMMQMMILQQNAALIAQQQEMMKSVGLMSQNRDNSKSRDASRSRSRPRPDEPQSNYINYKTFENKSHVGNTDYSELNYDADPIAEEGGFDAENIRAASVSVERKRQVQAISPMLSNQKKFNKKQNFDPVEKVQQVEEPKIYKKALAIVMHDATCTINPNLRLLEGDIITVERYLPELDLYQCRYDNNVGLFSKDAIKIVVKKGQKEENKRAEKSVERKLESLNSDRRNIYNLNKGIDINKIQKDEDLLEVHQMIENSQYNSRDRDNDLNDR